MTATEIDHLKQSICDSCGITVDDMMSRSRVTMCVYARRIFCSIMRIDSYNLQSIGDMVGITHATVLNNIKAHDDAMHYDKLYKSIVDDLNLVADTADYTEAHRCSCPFVSDNNICADKQCKCDSDCEYMQKFNELIMKV